MATSVTMNIFRALKFRPFALPPRQAFPQNLQSAHVIYERRPPWWSRWTYAIIAADVVVIAGSCELVWNHWTEFQEASPDAPPTPDAKHHPASLTTDDKVPLAGEDAPSGTSVTIVSSSDNTAQPKGQYVLRPWPYRAVYVVAQLCVGYAVAAALYGTQARLVRKISIMPPSASSSSTVSAARVASKSAKAAKKAAKLAKKANAVEIPKLDGRSVFIQSTMDRDEKGVLLPIQNCKLEKGKKVEMAIRCEGFTGVFSLELDDATVEGRKMALQDSRDALWKAWYGEEKGQKLGTEERWTKGRISQK